MEVLHRRNYHNCFELPKAVRPAVERVPRCLNLELLS
jgi:hypothetical protein